MAVKQFSELLETDLLEINPTFVWGVNIVPNCGAAATAAGECH